MASNSRRIYMGNLPFRATKEEVLRVCEIIGPVVSLQLMQDNEGKSKGYAFCEYKDEETALSALRNLRGYEMGGRELRVNFAGKNVQSSVCATAVPGDHAARGGPQPAAGAPGDHDALASYLAAASREELNQILSELTFIATQNPEFARQLLECNPPLVGAIVSLAATTIQTSVCAGQKRRMSACGSEGSQQTEIDRPAKLPRLEEAALLESNKIIPPFQCGVVDGTPAMDLS